MTRTLPLADPGAISEAARLLRAGGLVAFPTETVYGLGAIATDETAVAGIFEAKGRPRFNPLIVHLPERARVDEIAEITPDAARLADAFWPGPLTLVLPRKAGADLSLLASAGLPTIAVRVPAHEGARALLEAVDAPVAAPSANASGRLSPSTAAHVAASLRDRVDLILDGGPCAVGLESAIVDASGARPALLRPGGVAAEEIEAALGRPLLRADESGADAGSPKAPGMLASHYAPGLPIRLDARAPRPGEAFLAFGADAPAAAAANLSPTGDLREAAATLFALLHELDDPTRYAGIAAAQIPEVGLGRAINDRLRRAAAPRG
ncbi:MAG: L-threonylcarbamoyladenylate synthase [Marivibrio sp.]|uniref:L-threonylcarbamoyladenylate synthase n=1 Tax=Marivibrio sp. TaxID=2039719 RepID=UPI0032F013BC